MKSFNGIARPEEMYTQQLANSVLTERESARGTRSLRAYCNITLEWPSFGASWATERPVFSEEVNDTLFEFLGRKRSTARSVSNRLLSEEAVKISHSLQLENFAASRQYIKRGKQRFGTTMRHPQTRARRCRTISRRQQRHFALLLIACEHATTTHHPTFVI